MELKKEVEDLAIFGGSALFSQPKSTSNLIDPDFKKFMDYSMSFIEQSHYTNNGPNARLLEERLASFHDAEHCVAFCSGFWALVLSISALALEDRTEVAMPSFTYRRMADIAAWTRLKPRFCEVESDTLAMSARTLEPYINENTAIVLAVHPIVNCCDVDGLVTLARERNLPILFDSVESVYESVPSGKIGRFGDAEAFSLHASKFLNGFEGGYITTNNHDLAESLKLMRAFGFTGPDNVGTVGATNAKLNEIHAAMALASLDDVEAQVERNRERYYAYKELLSSIPSLRLLEFDENHQTGFKNIVVELLDEWPLSREETIQILNADRILARAYYSPPLHQKPMSYPYFPAELPLTDRLAGRFMNFPCGHFVTTQDIEVIVRFLEFLSQNAGPIHEQMKNH